MHFARIVLLSLLVEVPCLWLPVHPHAGDHQDQKQHDRSPHDNTTDCPEDDDADGWNERRFPYFAAHSQQMGIDFKSMCTKTDNGFIIRTNESAPGPEIVFWHLEKTGGTTMLEWLGRYTRTTIHNVNEHGQFTPNLWGDKFFRIAPIRESCSFYNSLYHWGEFPWRVNTGWTAKHLDQQGLGERFYGGGHSKSKFKDWLKHINGIDNGKNQREHQGCGLLSMRFWTQVIHPEALYQLNNNYLDRFGPRSCRDMEPCPCPLGDFVAEAPEAFLKNCSDDIANFDFSKIDCWIRSDHTHADFRACLDKYQKRGGTLRGKPTLDWKANGNKHPECASMYDSTMKKWLEDADGDLMRRFGYNNKCCESHTGEGMPFNRER